MKFLLRRHPKLIDAVAVRHEKYNRQREYIFSREKAGAALVICPEKPLGISRTEKNTDELERVYQEGRAVATKRLEEIKRFIQYP